MVSAPSLPIAGGRVSIPQPFPCCPQGINRKREAESSHAYHAMNFQPTLTEVTITTDGGCNPNPGTGGWACVLRSGVVVKELSGFEENTTNNRMEWLAIIKGLEALKRKCRVRIRTDSMICVYALQGRGKKMSKRGNLDLALRARDLFEQHEATIEWVRGHSGDPDNERCDALAGAAILRAGVLDFSSRSPCSTP